ncbi:MAG: DUF362 domain-containing protein [Myxococcales bacterium]|nr:DUF362 domain-containing protein [Myxococcales bacterium]
MLKTGLRAGAGLLVPGTAAGYFLDREKRTDEMAAAQVRNYSVESVAAHPDVVMVHGSDPLQTLERTLSSLGGIERFIERGDRVVIKPNIGWERFPEQAANTNPMLVAHMVALCQRAGAEEVIVTDASCNDANRSYHKSGIGQAAYNAGARVLLPQPHRFREMELGGGILRRWAVYQPFIQADKVINMAIVKHHSLTMVTAGMKNWYGILGGTRNLLHQDIHQSIFDLAHFMRPTLTILDGIRVLVRNGPQGGSYDDVERRDVIIAGIDQVACDSLAAGLLGRRPDELRYLRMADGVIGHTDMNRIRYREIT